MSERFDVIVVGAGTAGIPTAIEAAAAGARVLLVEKDHRLGGTLHTTGGHVAGAGTRRQRAHGIEDTREAWIGRHPPHHPRRLRQDIIDPVVEHATEFIDWLDDHGFRFDPATPRIIYGHEPYYTPRTYYGVDAGVSLLDVFTPLLDEHVAAGRSRSGPTPPCSACSRTTPATAARSPASSRCAAAPTSRSHARRRRARDRRVRRRRRAVRRARGLPAGLGRAPDLDRRRPAARAGGRAPRSRARASTCRRSAGSPTRRRPGACSGRSGRCSRRSGRRGRSTSTAPAQRWVAEDEPSIDAKERALVAHVRRPHVLDDLRRPRRRGVRADGRELDARRRARHARTSARACTQRRHPRRARRARPASTRPGCARRSPRYNEHGRAGRRPRLRAHAPARADRAGRRSTRCATTASPS